MAAMEHHVRLAQSLHPRLLRLFTRFPPPQLQSRPQQLAAIPASTQPAPPTDGIEPVEAITSSTPQNTSPDTATPWPTNDGQKRNPFLPFKNPRTGTWHAPHYSLRRQAELFNLARQHHVLPLMPMSPKHPDVRDQKRLDRALRAAQTGLLPISGKKAKGKFWERSLRTRMEERRRAMEGMPEMIRLWKQKGHGRGWKKWPR